MCPSAGKRSFFRRETSRMHYTDRGAKSPNLMRSPSGKLRGPIARFSSREETPCAQNALPRRTVFPRKTHPKDTRLSIGINPCPTSCGVALFPSRRIKVRPRERNVDLFSTKSVHYPRLTGREIFSEAPFLKSHKNCALMPEMIFPKNDRPRGFLRCLSLPRRGKRPLTSIKPRHPVPDIL